MTWTRVKTTRLPRLHVTRDASTSTTATEKEKRHQAAYVAAIITQQQDIPRYQKTLRHTRKGSTKNIVQTYLAKGSRFLGRCPSASLFVLLASSQTSRNKNAPGLFSSFGNVWHLLMPCHLLMAFGLWAREKRNTLSHVSNNPHFLLLEFLNASEHVCMLPCFDIFSCPFCARAQCSSPWSRGNDNATRRWTT